MRAPEIGPEDRGVQTIFRVVRDPDRLILGVISDDTQHGAKISSWAIVMLFFTLTNTVGFTK